MDRKSSVATLTSIQSAGVAPEVNLGITQARKYTSEGSTLALKLRAHVTISPKQGSQWPHEEDVVQFFFKLVQEPRLHIMSYSNFTIFVQIKLSKTESEKRNLLVANLVFSR